MWNKDSAAGPTKIVKHHHSVKKFQTPSVSRRNARERNRVKQVNSGFSILKEHVPHLKNKTSKVNTLYKFLKSLGINSHITSTTMYQIYAENLMVKYFIKLQVDTLRAAVDYIKTLRELLGEPLGKFRSQLNVYNCYTVNLICRISN